MLSLVKAFAKAPYRVPTLHPVPEAVKDEAICIEYNGNISECNMYKMKFKGIMLVHKTGLFTVFVVLDKYLMYCIEITG